MTLQVGLFGTDGIVLASDTSWASQNSKVRYTTSRSKIVVNHERRIAVSFARNMESSEKAANAISSQITDEQWESPKSRIEELVTKAIHSLPHNRADANCIVVSATPELRLFNVDMSVDLSKGTEARPLCWEHSDKAFAGDEINPSVYWAERYYERIPVSQLLPIAVQIITNAGKLSPDRIRGLEVVVCQDAEFRRLSESDIEGLISWSNSLDKVITKSFAKCARQFTQSLTSPRLSTDDR
jgi:uncharacterized alpha-E superfamily protein